MKPLKQLKELVPILLHIDAATVILHNQTRLLVNVLAKNTNFGPTFGVPVFDGIGKEIIKNTNLSDKGGAGLGFVDMARKSGQKLEYGFRDLDQDYAFFSLLTKIARV